MLQIDHSRHQTCSLYPNFGHCWSLIQKSYMQKKVLLVDDNLELLNVLRLSLKAAGFSVATATNGLDALKKVRTLRPDAIVLDLVLPQMDGFALCEILRRDPDTASSPVIMVTGMSGQFTRYAGFESGATDFITKPFDTNELISKMKTLLAARKGRTSRPKALAKSLLEPASGRRKTMLPPTPEALDGFQVAG